MKINGSGGVNWRVAALLLLILIAVFLWLVSCQPPTPPPPAPCCTLTPTATVTATTVLVTSTPTRANVPPTVKPPTRTPRPEDFYTTVEEPKDMIFWRDVLWVVSRRGTLHVIDPRDMKIVYSRGTGGKEAWGIAAAEFSGKAKIAVTHGDGLVVVVDPNQMLVVGQLRLGGQLGRPVALGRYLFVPIHDQWSVAVVDLFDPEKPGGKLVNTIKTEVAPFTAAVNFATGEVLVTHRDSNKISILDGQTGRLKGLFPIEGARSLYSLATEPTLGTIFISYAPEADADRLGRLAVFRYDFSERLDDIQTCHLGEGGQIVVGNSLGIKVFLPCHGEDKVLSFTISAGASHATYTVGRFPFGLAFDEEGNHIFVGLKGENKVKKVW